MWPIFMCKVNGTRLGKSDQIQKQEKHTQNAEKKASTFRSTISKIKLKVFNKTAKTNRGRTSKPNIIEGFKVRKNNPTTRFFKNPSKFLIGKIISPISRPVAPGSIVRKQTIKMQKG